MFTIQEWERKAAADKKRYEAEYAEYKSSGAAARFAASSSSSFTAKK